MWKKVNEYVQKNHMIKENETIAVGISGGADSVCLMRYLLSIREKKKLTILGVHVNHMLRGEEAERDECFTRNFCESWAIPLFTYHIDVKKESAIRKCSEEEAGREIRYECFREVLKKQTGDKIAVAHHQNDLVETMLFRMARGTGLTGLGGIRPIHQNVIRPLLVLEKKDILRILEQLDQPFVEDSTNKEIDYSRNYIRHQILPDMEMLNHKALGHMGALALSVQELMDYIEPKMDKLYKEAVMEEHNRIRLFREKFDMLETFEKKEIVRRMLFSAAGRRKDITAFHVELIINLMEKDEGKIINLPYALLARRTEGGIEILDFKQHRMDIKEEKRAEQKESVSYILPEMKIGDEKICHLPGNGGLKFQLFPYNGEIIEKSDCVKTFDYDKIKGDIHVRQRLSGDYFIINQQGKHKSLKRYFIDNKVPAEERDRRILLAEDSHIIWVIGGRISEFYKVTADTRLILKVTYEKNILFKG